MAALLEAREEVGEVPAHQHRGIAVVGLPWDVDARPRARGHGARLCTDLERLQYLSTRQVEARESWGLTGSQALAELLCQDADLGRKASAIRWLAKSVSYCSKQ
jgi:hypothetical protein